MCRRHNHVKNLKLSSPNQSIDDYTTLAGINIKISGLYLRHAEKREFRTWVFLELHVEKLADGGEIVGLPPPGQGHGVEVGQVVVRHVDLGRTVGAGGDAALEHTPTYNVARSGLAGLNGLPWQRARRPMATAVRKGKTKVGTTRCSN